MKKWVTSDLHFGHDRIRQFCPKTRSRFVDVVDMREKMIAEWNTIVQSDDIVYILGDVAFMSGFEASKVINRLNGSKILIVGNHDKKTLKDIHFQNSFKEIHNYHEFVHNGTLIVMFHYPIFDHNQAGRGSIMLHGHRHGNPTNLPGRIMDVGMDSTGEIVSSLDEIVKKMQSVPHMYHHYQN